MHLGTAHHSSQDLPQRLTKFIGRKIELAELKRLLQERKFVTLTGAGGSGKTRLALEFASAMAEDFPGDIFFVELAPLSRTELLVETVARLLGVEADVNEPLLDALTQFLRTRSSLLVLDNCEHMIGECARLAGILLATCPDLFLLATSREPLGVEGECMFRVPLLSLPTLNFMAYPDKLLGFEAVQLFVDRARLANPNFALNEGNAEAVANVCVRLDGIPLAIELAAASQRALTVSQLAARIDQRFKLLTSGDRTALPRQQTLKAMLDWSHTLLTPVEQVVFRRLAVFPGDWTLEAAEHICMGNWSEEDTVSGIVLEGVLDELIRLVDKSLVQLDTVGGRYRLLETIRLYALTKLEEAGESGLAHRRHVDWYLRIAEEGSRQVGTPGQHAWYLNLEAEQDNIRAALAWAIEEQLVVEAARLALAVRSFWEAKAYHREGFRWLEQIVALDSMKPMSVRLKAELLSALGSLTHDLNNFEQSNLYHTEALRLWREQGDSAAITGALLALGWQSFQAVDLDVAERYVQESLALARNQGDARAIGAALSLLGIVRAESGKPHGVIPVVEESLSIGRGIGALDQVATALMAYGRAEQQLGNLDHACSLLLEALQLQISLGTYTGLIGCFSIMVHFARETCPPPEKYVFLAKIFGVFETLQEKIGGGTSRWHEREAISWYEMLARELGEEVVAREMGLGRALTVGGIVALAEEIVGSVRAISHSRASSLSSATFKAESSYPVGLTPREVEVLRLVADGLTNQQAADRLSVTSRTINAHLTSIYSKIGVTSRAGAVRFATEQKLN